MPVTNITARIAIVGGGVIGTSCAAYLANERRFKIDLYERMPGSDFPTSPAAAAFWTPFALEIDPSMGFTEASLALPTLHRFRALASEAPTSGVSWCRDCREYFGAPWQREKAPERWWHARSEINVRWLPKSDLPQHPLLGPIVAGCAFEVPIIHVGRYLRFLRRQLRANPRYDEHYRDVRSLAELEAQHDLVINCTGLDAPLLTPDTAMQAIQGQVLRVKNRSFSRLIFLEEGKEFANEPLYIVPRGDDVVLGGTVKKIVAGPITLKNKALMQPDPAVTQRILDRCAVFFPECRDSLIEPIVRLRPKRNPLRIELDMASWRVPVVHCYGHGGSGVTLSWGSAEHVAELVKSALALPDRDLAA